MLNFIKSKLASDILIALSTVCILFILIQIAIPINHVGYFNFDESIELVRVHLLNRHYHFFDEVWSDHPLGLPLFLKTISKFFPLDLPTARRIITVFSAINIITFYALLRLNCQKLAAWVGCIVLITSMKYLYLSGLVFNELPSLTITMICLLSIALYCKYAKRNPIRGYSFLCLSAFLFIVSFEIKISVITVIPSLICFFVLADLPWKQKARDLAIGAMIVCSLFLIASSTILPFSYQDMIGVHTQASSKFAETDLTLQSLLQQGLKHDAGYIIILTLGLLSIPWMPSKSVFWVPIIWLGVNFIRMVTVLPVWPNYYIYLAIPAAWIIALYVNHLNLEEKIFHFQTSSINIKKILLPLFIILSFMVQCAFSVMTMITASHPKKYRDEDLVFLHQIQKNYKQNPVQGFLSQYKDTHKVILTDDPYLIYKFKLDTPPETAILSRKRLMTEGIDGNFILNVIQKRHPDFIFFYRFQDTFMESANLTQFLGDYYTEYPLQKSQGRFFYIKSLNTGLITPHQ